MQEAREGRSYQRLKEGDGKGQPGSGHTPVPVTQDYWALAPTLLPQREPQVCIARASDGYSPDWPHRRWLSHP